MCMCVWYVVCFSLCVWYVGGVSAHVFVVCGKRVCLSACGISGMSTSVCGGVSVVYGVYGMWYVCVTVCVSLCVVCLLCMCLLCVSACM